MDFFFPLMDFRKLDPSDLDPCLAILKKNYPTDFEYWKPFLLRDVSKEYFLVALIDNTLVGFGAYIPLENQPNIFRLTWINVPPKEQGKGIGKALVLELENIIKLNNGPCRVVLESDKPRFYEKIAYASYHKAENSEFMLKDLV